MQCLPISTTTTLDEAGPPPLVSCVRRNRDSAQTSKRNLTLHTIPIIHIYPILYTAKTVSTIGLRKQLLKFCFFIIFIQVLTREDRLLLATTMVATSLLRIFARPFTRTLGVTCRSGGIRLASRSGAGGSELRQNRSSYPIYKYRYI